MNLQGKQHLSSQPSTIGTASKGSDVKSQLANAILHGVGSARDMLMKRKVQAQSQAQGDHYICMIRWRVPTDIFSWNKVLSLKIK